MSVRAAAGLLLATLLAGCSELGGEFFDPYDDRPELTSTRYRWIETGWRGTQPLGQGAVELTWRLPAAFNGESFRVFARRSSDRDYLAIATVTSCAGSTCRYVDLNVAPDRSYDYYVAMVNERTGRELSTSDAVRVRVPPYAPPAAPEIQRVVGLDGAVYLRWRSTGAELYRVFVERVGADSVFYEVGSTDGTGYLDLRARNGRRYSYRVAAVDTLGHVSARSALATAVPRPDYQADLLYPLGVSADSSGFRFVASEGESPTVPGTSASAQWRLEVVNGTLSIVPLSGTGVTPGIFTSALTCGPASEADCVSVDRVTAAHAFGTAPVPLLAAHTYLFRLGSGSSLHYGKIRVDGSFTDARGRTAVIFDWAYQPLANEPSLLRGR